MQQFSQLIKTLDSTNKTTVKVNALADYFMEAQMQIKFDDSHTFTPQTTTPCEYYFFA